MAKVVWDRMQDIANARDVIPYTPRSSRENFRPPSTIESDFSRLLDHDVKHVNWTFELIHDWYYVSTQTEESLAALTAIERKRLYDGGTRIIRIHKTETVGREEQEYNELRERLFGNQPSDTNGASLVMSGLNPQLMK